MESSIVGAYFVYGLSDLIPGPPKWSSELTRSISELRLGVLPSVAPLKNRTTKIIFKYHSQEGFCLRPPPPPLEVARPGLDAE